MPSSAFIEAVIANIITSAISAFFVFLFKKILKAIQYDSPPRATHTKSFLQKYFLTCAVLAPLSLTAGCLMPVNLPLIKILCFLAAFYSFIFEWGSFDAAISFYPSDNPVQIPSDDTPQHHADNKS